MKEHLFNYLINFIPTTRDILEEEMSEGTEYGLFIQGLIKEMEKAYELGRISVLQEKQKMGRIEEGEDVV